MADEPWFTQLPEDLTIEQDGKPVPLRDIPFVKEAKDLPSFVKTAFDAHKEIGARVRIPGKDAKPEDVAAFKERLTKEGLLPAPVGKPEDYGFVKPAELPKGLQWNEEGAKKFASTLHKHGATKELATDLMGLYTEMVAGSQMALATSVEQGIAALKQEHGDKYEERVAAAGRLGGLIFKTPEELKLFEATGLGNHPGFLSVLMRLAPLAEQDTSFIAEMMKPDGEKSMDADEVRSELGRIMSDKTHPMHEGYWRKDKKVMDHIDELYARAHGRAPVEIH